MKRSAPSTIRRLGAPLPDPYAFEVVSDRARNRIEYQGLLGTVIDDLEPMVAENQLEPGFWHPGRLVRAIIDAGQKGTRIHRGSAYLDFINDTTQFVLGMYAGVPDQRLFRRITDQVQKRGLRRAPVEQTFDEWTLEGTRPRPTWEAADRIAQKTSGPLLIIPLCHGGLVAGAQTFLYHQQTKRNAIMYPVRHSRTKHEDTEPRISRLELSYLRDLAARRTVVIFDEDAATGSTIDVTIRYLAKRIQPKQIIGVAAHDVRTMGSRAKQGEWWEFSRFDQAA